MAAPGLLCWPGWPGWSGSLRHSACSVVGLVITVSAQAHGDWKPSHGGQMNDGETSFELVVRPTSARFYVSDHGVVVLVAGATGTLTVEHAGRQWTTPVVAAAVNRLDARLQQPIVRGDKVVVRVVMANGSVAVGRFVAR